jgi:arylsulfatase A-like enzyme
MAELQARLTLLRPHTPLYVPRKYFDGFDPSTLALPPVLNHDVDDCAVAVRDHSLYGYVRYQILMEAGGEPLWRRWLQAYLASIAFVDDQLGMILDALDGSRYADNTLIVFTSDNGYHMGEKEYLFKDSLWEESARVPLVVRVPGLAAAGRTCATPVSLIDLYPTLTDLCRLPGRPHAHTHGLPLAGHSLRPLLEDPLGGAWPGPPIALTSSRERTGLHHTVRSATHRYTLCENGEEELYDHRSDPWEWHNLAGDPEQTDVKANLRRQLRDLHQRTQGNRQ